METPAAARVLHLDTLAGVVEERVRDDEVRPGTREPCSPPGSACSPAAAWVYRALLAVVVLTGGYGWWAIHRRPR